LARCQCLLYGLIPVWAHLVRELVDQEPIPIEAEDPEALVRAAGQPLPKVDA
jgi:hypothetical protein